MGVHEKVIAKFVHGNAIGVIVEIDSAEEVAHSNSEWKPWHVRIGSMHRPGSDANDHVEEEFARVIADLGAFCREHGRADERGRW